MKKPIKIGDKFGRLVVLQSQRTQNRPGQLCQCECGSEPKAYRDCDLQSGNSKSCGCLRVAIGRKRGLSSRKHGMYNSRVYHIWEMMKQRCLNPNAVGYEYYGGRGILVDERWITSFEAFYSDMGDPPSLQHTLDRKDNDGPYTLDNCRWATDLEQARNRPSTQLITFKGVTKTWREWSEQLGININTIHTRRRAGWSIEKILSTPSAKGTAV
jgi:hypothetical protein